MTTASKASYKKSRVLVPNHIAIIPDGNRRWARARGQHTLQGHKKGFDNAVALCRASRRMGIHTVTIWGFSTENWDRTHEEKTAKNKKHIINIALDYGGQDEILRAIKGMIHERISEEKVDKETFEKYLDTYGQPYPYVDMIIRTSGEQRTSGLLLWQGAYAETYWEQDHFPDFGPDKLWEAIQDFSRLRRRFGGDDKVTHLNFEPKVAAKLEVQWWRLENIPEGTKFSDYAFQHIREQFGLSKVLAVEAAKLLVEAILQGKKGKWNKAVLRLKEFYQIIKSELKLSFEPNLVATLEVQLWQKTANKERVESMADAEDVAQEYYAEVYRVSLLQAAKAAHLRILALRERNLAERGMGEHHWVKAEDYLEKFYSALRERVA